MTKKYSFNYNSFDASAEFVVDLEKFTPELARSTLDFFTWRYDEDADPIDEVMKKYARSHPARHGREPWHPRNHQGLQWQ